METTTVQPKPNKLLYRLATIVSIIIPIVVILLDRIKFELVPAPQVYTLPLINAICNATCAVVLIAALVFAKQGKIKLHARMIYLAMVISLIFLLGYIAYHISIGHTSFGGTGTIKTVYYILLFSHIALAGIQTPFVLFSFVFGYTGEVQKHKKLVKFAFPIWLYVSITGVICYLMISPYYPIQ